MRYKLGKDKRTRTEKLSKEASDVNLILIGPAVVKNRSKKRYQFKDCRHYQDIGIKEVRENRFRCQTCLNLKLKKEAEEQNLILLGEGKNPQYRTYQFKDCKHINELTTGNVRKGGKHIGCAICRQEKLESEASSAGVKILGPGTNVHYRNYLIEECGHSVNLKTQSVRDNTFKCPICKDEQFINEAKSVALTLIGEASADLDVSIKRSNYRLYKIDECGHEQNLKLSHVRDGNFNCDTCNFSTLTQRAKFSGYSIVGQNNGSISNVKCLAAGHPSIIKNGQLGRGKIQCLQCFEDRLRKEAHAANLTYQGQADRKLFDANFRLYTCNRCKNELTMRITNVKIKSFLCEYCDESHLDLPSNVYLLKVSSTDFTWVKLGYARDVPSRIMGYGLTGECNPEILEVLPFNTGREAKRFELSLHAKYKKLRLDASKMKRYHKQNGQTECYSLDAKNILHQELVNRENSSFQID